MCELCNSLESCKKCGKLYVALLAKDSCACPGQIVIDHKGDEIETAAVLKWRKRAEVAFNALKEAGTYHQGQKSRIGIPIREAIQKYMEIK